MTSPMDARLPRVYRALGVLPAPPLAPLLAPLDALRARLLRVLAPRARSLVVDRSLRVSAVASLLLIAAYVSASVVPLWVVALGPIVWGIPHIVSDIRYLVTRPGYHLRPLVLVIMAGGILAAALGAGIRGALGAAIIALLVARGPIARRAVGIAVALALFAVAQRVGWMADLAFAHLHNAVGVGLWWSWRRRTTRLHWVPLLLFVTGSALLLAGAAEPILLRTHGLYAPWTGLSVLWLSQTLSFTMAGPWPARFVVLYAFAQSAHYLVWLRLIPEDDRKSPTPRSFAQSYRALRADVGSLILWGAVASALALAVWAVINLAAARDGYIRAAFFHGYIEIVAAALLFAEGTKVNRV